MSILQTAYSNDESFWDQLTSDEGVSSPRTETQTGYKVFIEEIGGKYIVGYTYSWCHGLRDYTYYFSYGNHCSGAKERAHPFVNKAWASMRAAKIVGNCKAMQQRDIERIEKQKKEVEKEYAGILAKVEEYKTFLLQQAGIEE